MTTSLPSPTTVIGGDRTLSYRWVVDSFTDEHGRRALEVLDLDISYDKSNRRFNANLRPKTVATTESGGTVTKVVFSLSNEDDGHRRIASRDVGRYSEKQMQQFAEHALNEALPAFDVDGSLAGRLSAAAV